MKKFIPGPALAGSGWTNQTVKGNADNIATNASSIATMNALYAKYGADEIAESIADINDLMSSSYLNKTILVKPDTYTMNADLTMPGNQKWIWGSPKDGAIMNNAGYAMNAQSTDFCNDDSAAWNVGTNIITVSNLTNLSGSAANLDAYDDSGTGNVTGAYVLFAGNKYQVTQAREATHTITVASSPGAVAAGSANRIVLCRNPIENMTFEGKLDFGASVAGASRNLSIVGAHGFDFKNMKFTISKTVELIGMNSCHIGEYVARGLTEDAWAYTVLFRIVYNRILSGLVIAEGNTANNASARNIIGQNNAWNEGLLSVSITNNTNSGAGACSGYTTSNTKNKFALVGMNLSNKSASAYGTGVNVAGLVV